MDDAINFVGADNAFEFVVVANIRVDKWDINIVLDAKVLNAMFQSLVQRIVDDYRFAGTDEFISNMCADVSGSTCK